jgi:hypothetical protein
MPNKPLLICKKCNAQVPGYSKKNVIKKWNERTE